MQIFCAAYYLSADRVAHAQTANLFVKNDTGQGLRSSLSDMKYITSWPISRAGRSMSSRSPAAAMGSSLMSLEAYWYQSEACGDSMWTL